MNKFEAEQILEEGAQSNPGPWIAHSRNTALAAEKIAQKTQHLDPDQAFIYGLLHDIGKQDIKIQNRHPLVGYDFMMERDERDIAQICLTHPYSLQDPKETLGYDSYSEEEKRRIEGILPKMTYSDYDSLIQLCDGLALPEGIVLLEKRLFDVHLRHGFNDYTIKRWKKLLDIKSYFDKQIGNSIYELFDDISDNTFGLHFS